MRLKYHDRARTGIEHTGEQRRKAACYAYSMPAALAQEIRFVVESVAKALRKGQTHNWKANGDHTEETYAGRAKIIPRMASNRKRRKQP
jgi:hypothetical protein